ncbi:nucleotidyltransferase [soil metagenome]
MKPTLLILAAGMASRYGSMKQIQEFGPDGETIMDYSIYDAIRAGFGKVVFVIRKEFEENFRNIFEPKLNGKIETVYVDQSLNSFTESFQIPAERSKPWGTAHAVLCARNAINEPFAVINADDFYGRDAFEKAVEFLNNSVNEKTYAIIGYDLSRTLSENGTVSRGVCEVNSTHELVSITERTKIYRQENSIVYEEAHGKHQVDDSAKVSMNFWCFHQSVFPFIEQMFKKFLQQSINEPKSEFFIPILGDAFIKEKGGTIKVITTFGQWFGVTYKEDASGVKESIGRLINSVEYPQALWSESTAGVP